MNQILGGGPQSRLFLDLREEHSYTYGSYSSVSTDIYPGDWIGYAPVRTPVTDGAMTQFVYEYKRIVGEAVPETEIDDAHHTIIAGFALSLEQPTEVLFRWLSVEYFGLPADYWDKYPDRIAAVDAAAIQSGNRQEVCGSSSHPVGRGRRPQTDTKHPGEVWPRYSHRRERRP